MNEPQFHLTASGAIDVLGVWGTVVAPTAFAATEPPGVESWRVNLPPTAASALDDRTAALRGALRGVAAADRRLTAFMVHPDSDRTPAFSPAARAVAGPEQELAAWVQSVRGEVNFGWPGLLTSGWWQDAAREVGDFFTQLTRSLDSAAQIETSVGEEWAGVTVVGWRGGTVTAWRTGADRAAAEAHGRSVALALATQRAWLGLATTVVSGAAGLAVQLAAPGGFILTIPATWRFVRRVMADLRRVEEVNG